jgi:1-acyl-sn-glycerol-3-phosphate acyltransferase
MSSSDYKQKYLKYKQKYLDLKNQLAGAIYYDESRNIERVDRELNEVLLDRRYEFGTWNLFVKYADDFVFKVRGWALEGEYPESLKKSIVIVAPHASWIDFPVGLCARSMMKVPIFFWGKKELFDGFFGWMFRWLGGYPVDRKNKSKWFLEIQ